MTQLLGSVVIRAVDEKPRHTAVSATSVSQYAGVCKATGFGSHLTMVCPFVPIEVCSWSTNLWGFPFIF